MPQCSLCWTHGDLSDFVTSATTMTLDGMRGNVTIYVRTCPICQCVKLENWPKAGPLQPLEIPTEKWAQVTTDLAINLPESNGYSVVAVFVDRLQR